MEPETAFKQMLWGNGLLVVCCGFYLLWWILAFKPAGAIKGIRSGWLLVPAFVFGMAAVYLILRSVLNLQLGQPRRAFLQSPACVRWSACSAISCFTAWTSGPGISTE